MKIEIKTIGGSLLFEGDFSCLSEAVQAAVKKRANLRSADLGGAYLVGADLRSADLGGAYLVGAYLGSADLRSAYLVGADLRGADLGGAALRGADLGGANLRSADLRSAYLVGAYLGGADLRSAYLGGAYLGGAALRIADLGGAYLGGAEVNWQSHALISEILLRAAGEDVEKRKVAGLVAVSTDWCWDKLLAIKDKHRMWALKELAKWVTEGDGAPELLAKLAKKEKAS